MAKNRILIVGRDARLRALLARWLIDAAYAVELADGPKRARDLAARDSFALAIIAPGGFEADGAALLGELAQQAGRIIVLTGPDSPPEAFALDPDRRMAQPLREDEVLARVAAALAVPDQPVLAFDALTVNVAARTCTDANGQPVALTRGEFSLLAALARRPDQLVTRDELRRVVAGRGGAEPDDRSLDVLMSRLRRKIEDDAKQPRAIVTLPGEGYKFTLTPKEPAGNLPKTLPAGPVTLVGDSLATTLAAELLPSASLSPSNLSPTGPRPPGRTVPASEETAFAASSARRGRLHHVWRPALVAAVAIALVAVTVRYGFRTSGDTPAKFDAAAMPLLDDDARRDLATYAAQPDFKALAIKLDSWGLSVAAPTIEEAKREAIAKCNAQGRPRLETVCNLYAVGTDVVWPSDLLRLPLPADIHREPLDGTFTTAAIPLLPASARAEIDQRYKGDRPRALAVTKTHAIWNNGDTREEAVRLTIERCARFHRVPCLLLSVDGQWTTRIPQSRRIDDVFLLASEAGMTDADRRRVGEIYARRDWRAIAHGNSGGWYPVADAPSEANAVLAALASCEAHDQGCRLYAIGNFRVAE
jgi:DNA-binding response OmpR family regulator